MQIEHDRSYISNTEKELVRRGYGYEDFHSIRLQFVYTDDEQVANKAFADTHTTEEWNMHCDSAVQKRSAEVQKIMEAIDSVMICYQYNKPTDIGYDSSEWDLFFWCNDLYQTTRGSLSGRDYSYITLTFNKKHSADKKAEIYQKVMGVLSQFADNQNIYAAVQYQASLDDKQIRLDAECVASELNGMKHTFRGHAGRFVKTKSGLYFMKKYAKTYGSLLSPQDILSLSWHLCSWQIS